MAIETFRGHGSSDPWPRCFLRLRVVLKRGTQVVGRGENRGEAHSGGAMEIADCERAVGCGPQCELSGVSLRGER